MSKLYIAFHANGAVRDIATEPLEGYLPAPGKSTLALRYCLQDGKAVDRFPDKSDEEALALIAAEQAARASEVPAPRKIVARLAFMNRFTMEELTAIYKAAKTDVTIEVFLDKLKLAEEVDLNDPQTVGALQALATRKLLTEARAKEALQ